MKRRLISWIVTGSAIAAVLACLYFTRESWGPAVARPLAGVADWLDPSRASEEHSHDHDRVMRADRGTAKDEADDRIELSEQAQQNIGLKTIDLKPDTFARTISVPGIVTEKPGHSDVEVTAQIAGIVTQVFPLRGETVEPGDPLFRLRLTHEEIVQAQADLLKTTEKLDVVAREIKRLGMLVEGGVEGRSLIEKKYEQQGLEADKRAQTQALVLHGLTEEQVQTILTDRRLLKDLLIYAPGDAGSAERKAENVPPEHEVDRAVLEKPAEPRPTAGPARSATGTQSHRHSDFVPPRRRRFFEMETLMIEQGQHVDVGKPLCRLGDHTSLYIEGRAFEREAQLLTNAAAQGWPVSAAFESGGAKPEIVRELQIVYLANAVDRESRAFPFYIELPNEVARDARTSEGHRFLSWKYKPGQRVQLHVPVEQWPNRLVVPADAVVQDGAETYVFQRNGDLFERRTVHVEYQDQRSAVLANDGSVFPGEAIVVTGAYQLHLAIKNKAGGAIDPHAGHNH